MQPVSVMIDGEPFASAGVAYLSGLLGSIHHDGCAQ